MTKFSKALPAKKAVKKPHTVEDLTNMFKNAVCLKQTGSSMAHIVVRVNHSTTPPISNRPPTDVLTHDRNRKQARTAALAQARTQGLAQDFNETCNKTLF